MAEAFDERVANWRRREGAGRNLSEIIPAAKDAGLAFRMTEGNNCYRGGKPRMSNALAGALWGGDQTRRCLLALSATLFPTNPLRRSKAGSIEA